MKRNFNLTGHLGIIKILIDLKVDVNAEDDKLQTPLHLAAKAG